MSLPTDPTSQAGATPATNETVIDSELSDWVYHRASQDQGLSLNDIERDASIYTGTNFITSLGTGYSTGDDGFIYNQATGFCCAIVQEDNSNNFVIVVRGTDIGNGSLVAAAASAVAGTPSQTPGGVDQIDVYQDFQQGLGTRAIPTQIDDVLNVVAALQSSVPGANIRLTGQSLGGGDAAAAATIDGLTADVFDPAPFANQIIAENLNAAAKSVGINLPENVRLTLDPSVTNNDVINSGAASGDIVSVGDYVAAVAYDQYDTFLDNYNLKLAQQAGANINAYSIQGDLLTGGVTGWLFATASSQIPSGNSTSYNVGPLPGFLDLATALALHSPTLLALVEATNGLGSKGFANLLKGDPILQSAFYGANQGNTGVLSHDRSDDQDAAGTSRVTVSGGDTGILERALLKTVGDPNGFYAYFGQLFGQSLVSGALAAAQGADAGAPSLHSAFEKLTLDVFRDKVAGTSTVNDIYALNTGVSILSAVGGSGGAPLAGAVIIHKSDITATDPSQLATDGLQFGDGELDHVIWNDLRTATGSDTLTEKFLGLTQDQIFGAPASYDALGNVTGPAVPAQGLPWSVAVAQTSSGAFSFDPTDPSTGARDGDISKNLAIFGGAGTNTIKTGSGSNFVATGTGNSTITLGAGHDIVVNGGQSVIKAGSGSAVIVGGTGTSTVNSTSNGGTSNLNHSELFIGGNGDFINPGPGYGNEILLPSNNTGTTIVVTPGNLTIAGGDSNDRLVLLQDRITPASGPASLMTNSPYVKLTGGVAFDQVTPNIYGFVASWGNSYPQQSYDTYIAQYIFIDNTNNLNIFVDDVYSDASSHAAINWSSEITIVNFKQGDFGINLSHVSGQYTSDQAFQANALYHNLAQNLDLNFIDDDPLQVWSGVQSNYNYNAPTQGAPGQPTDLTTLQGIYSASAKPFGALPDKSISAGATINPFSGASFSDAEGSATDILNIQIDENTGTLTDGPGYNGLIATTTPGFYTITGTAASITEEANALIFTPEDVPAGETSVTTLEMSFVTTSGTSQQSVHVIVAGADSASPFGPDVGTPYTPPVGSDTLPSSGSFPLDGTVTGQHTITFQPGADSNVQVDVSNYGSRSYADIFKYARADGNVSIRDTSGANDVFEFIDLNSTDVSFNQVYSVYETSEQGTGSLAIKVISTGKTVTLDNWNRGDAAYGPQSFIFADGVSFSRAQILAAEQNQAPGPAQYRFDGAYTTTDLTTDRGGAPLSDVWFDQNNDTVYASTGVNTYHYALADGSAKIVDTTAQQGVLNLSDLNASDVTLSRTGTSSSDLLVTMNATGRTIDITNQFSNNGIGSIIFANGTVMTAAQIAAALDSSANSYLIQALDPFKQAHVHVTSASGQSISESATNNYDAIIGSNNTLTLASDLDLSVIGDSNTVSADHNDVINVVGAANMISLSGSSNTVVIGGNGQDAIYADSDSVTFANGGYLYEYDNSRVDAQGTGLIVTTGNNDTLGAYGSALTVNASGINNQIYIGGNGQDASNANDDVVIFANAGYISEFDNSRVDVQGTNVTVDVGTNDTLGAYGSALTVNVSGIGSEIYIGGNGQGASNADDDSVIFANGGYAYEFDNSRVDVQGTNVTVDVGTNDTLGAYGSALTVNVSGMNSQIYIGGNGQDASNANDDSVIFANGGYVYEFDNSRVDVLGSNLTAALGANDVFGLYGSHNSLTLGANDVIYLDPAASADELIFSGNTGATYVNSFGSGDMIDLLGGTGGYTSATAAFSSIQSDGRGGTFLSLGVNGSIDFINLATTSLSASNFKIG